MDKRPRFIIIAGPNGAGKSTFGHTFVPHDVVIFNGDLIFADLIRQYPNIDPERLKGGVPVALEKARDGAMSARKDFAFETNFSSDLIMELAERFKNEGYITTLIYFGLNDVELATSRVKTRVNFGGHDVPLETVKLNYEEGLKRVNDRIGFFDSVVFIDTSSELHLLASYDKKTAIYKLHSKEVGWFNKHFKASLEKIVHDQRFRKNLKQTEEPKQEEQPKRHAKRKRRRL